MLQITSHNREYITIPTVGVDTLNIYVMATEIYTKEDYGDTKIEDISDGNNSH